MNQNTMASARYFARANGANTMDLLTVVHTVFDIETVEKELVPLLQGDKSVAPSSKLGSNAGRAAADRKVPAIVFFAGAISPEDVSKVTVIVKRVAPAVHLVQATREEVRQAGATGPDPAIIAKVLKQKFTEALKA